jgi:hypothetical protein
VKTEDNRFGPERVRSSWFAEEPGYRAELAELTRVLHRGRCRPWLTVGLGLSFATLLFLAQIVKRKSYPGTVGLLMVENASDNDGRPESIRELQNFIDNVAFTMPLLLDIQKRRGLIMPLTRFRDNIDYEIYQDYFTDWRYEYSPLRSARIALTFKAPTPELALAVARDLANLIVEAQAARQLRKSEGEEDVGTLAHVGTADDVTRLRDELNRLLRATAFGASPDERLQLRRLKARLVAAELRVKSATSDLADIDTRRALATKRRGTRVMVVDEGVPVKQASPKVVLGRQIVVSLVGTLPVVILLVGAFNPRLYDVEDVRRAGFVALGRLRSRTRARTSATSLPAESPAS